MSESLPLLAMFDLAMFLVKSLAVLGGVAAGALGTGVLLKLSGRMITRKALPQGAQRIIQILGGCGLGLAVWLWVFGEGGGGLGWGGSLGLGGGTGKGPGNAEVTQAESKAKEGTSKAEEEKSPPVQTITLRVEMLGGVRVNDQRFYVLEGERQPLRLEELRRVLREKKQQKSPQLVGIEIVIYENSVAQDHPAVRDLDKWARENDLHVSLSFPKREAP